MLAVKVVNYKYIVSEKGKQMNEEKDQNMTEVEKALAGMFYDAQNKEIDKERVRSQGLSYQYNLLSPLEQKKRDEFIKKEIGSIGEGFRIEQPFYCDFWKNVTIGKQFFSNYNFMILAPNKIVIGDDVRFAPNCGIYAAGHPFDPEDRIAGIEYTWPVKIGNNVWIGAGTAIVGGVSIGDNSVIAAGSVVIKDISAGVLAAGNPCRVIRKLDPADDEKYKYGFPGFTV